MRYHGGGIFIKIAHDIRGFIFYFAGPFTGYPGKFTSNFRYGV